MVLTVRVAPGAGTVVRLPHGVVLVLDPTVAPDAIQRLRARLQDLEGTAFTSAVEAAATDVGPAAAVGWASQGWAVLAPSGVHVRSVYADRLSERDGPVHVVQRDLRQIDLLADGVTGPPEVEVSVLGEVSLPGAGVQIVVSTDPVDPVEPSTVRVEGRRCACGVLNPPQALWCTSCGRAVHGDTATTWGPRPPLGRLVLESGAAVDVDRVVVIGRVPHGSDAVRLEGARALQLADVAHRIADVHASLTPHGWDVEIVDHGAAEGTHVRPPDGWRWVRLDPGRPHRLLPDSTIRVGDHLIGFQRP